MQLFFTSYTFKENLDDAKLRELVKKFGEIGEAPGVVAHYVRADGRGGYTIAEQDDDNRVGSYEAVLAYAPYLDFESVPILTMEEALPSILKLYG